MTNNPIENVARAIVGDARYEAMPIRMSRQDRLWAGEQEWYDREDAHETARDAIQAIGDHDHAHGQAGPQQRA